MGLSEGQEGHKEPMRNPGIQEDLQAETTGNWTLSWIYGFLIGLRLEVARGNLVFVIFIGNTLTVKYYGS